MVFGICSLTIVKFKRQSNDNEETMNDVGDMMFVDFEEILERDLGKIGTPKRDEFERKVNETVRKRVQRDFFNHCYAVIKKSTIFAGKKVVHTPLKKVVHTIILQKNRL